MMDALAYPEMDDWCSCRIKEGGFRRSNRSKITDGLFEATKLQMGNMLNSR